MKKAILVNYTGRKGGGPLNAIEMTKALVSNGESVVAVISSDIENLEEWYKIPLEKLITIKTYTSAVSLIKNTIMFSLNNKKVIQEALSDYDIEYIYCPMVTFWTDIINSIFPKAKTVIVIHDPKPHTGALSFVVKYYQKLYRKADLRIVHSKVFKDLVCQQFGKAIYFPLGEHDIYKSIADESMLVDYPSDTINFLFFGRIEPYKGLGILLKAFCNLKKNEKVNISLTIAGSGDITEYEELIHSSTGIQVFNRWIKDSEVNSFFTGDNLVLVCPYIDATQSGPIIVAYGYEVPVIATKTGGLIEQVEDGNTGILVEPNSVESLEKAMKSIIDNPSILTDYKHGIRERNQKYSWHESAKILVSNMHSL